MQSILSRQHRQKNKHAVDRTATQGISVHVVGMCVTVKCTMTLVVLQNTYKISETLDRQCFWSASWDCRLEDIMACSTTLCHIQLNDSDIAHCRQGFLSTNKPLGLTFDVRAIASGKCLKCMTSTDSSNAENDEITLTWTWGLASLAQSQPALLIISWSHFLSHPCPLLGHQSVIRNRTHFPCHAH